MGPTPTKKPGCPHGATPLRRYGQRQQPNWHGPTSCPKFCPNFLPKILPKKFSNFAARQIAAQIVAQIVAPIDKILIFIEPSHTLVAPGKLSPTPPRHVLAPRPWRTCPGAACPPAASAAARLQFFVNRSVGLVELESMSQWAGAVGALGKGFIGNSLEVVYLLLDSSRRAEPSFFKFSNLFLAYNSASTISSSGGP